MINSCKISFVLCLAADLTACSGAASTFSTAASSSITAAQYEDFLNSTTAAQRATLYAEAENLSINDSTVVASAVAQDFLLLRSSYTALGVTTNSIGDLFHSLKITPRLLTLAEFSENSAFLSLAGTAKALPDDMDCKQTESSYAAIFNRDMSDLVTRLATKGFASSRRSPVIAGNLLPGEKTKPFFGVGQLRAYMYLCAGIPVANDDYPYQVRNYTLGSNATGNSATYTQLPSGRYLSSTSNPLTGSITSGAAASSATGGTSATKPSDGDDEDPLCYPTTGPCVWNKW